MHANHCTRGCVGTCVGACTCYRMRLMEWPVTSCCKVTFECLIESYFDTK